MPGAKIAVLLLLLAGCDRAFGLERGPECGAPPADNGDEDHDGVLNGADACPFLANQDPHDEDQDGVADACDLCPGLVEAGEDLDCDGIGAACDPDDTVPHVTTFFGFGSSLGLKLSNAVVENDGAALPRPFVIGDDQEGEVLTTEMVPAVGIYDLAGRFTRSGAATENFGTIGLLFRQGPGSNDLVARISGGYSGNQYGYLQLERGNNPPEAVGLPTNIGDLGTDSEFALHVVVTATTMEVTVSGFASGHVLADLPGDPGVVQWGLMAYHDAGGLFQPTVTYMRRTTLAR